jgi:hypothetical protein
MEFSLVFEIKVTPCHCTSRRSLKDWFLMVNFVFEDGVSGVDGVFGVEELSVEGVGHPVINSTMATPIIISFFIRKLL